MRKNFFLVKVFFLFIILFWIFKSVNIKEVLDVLVKVNVFYFLIALVLSNISNIFLTIKWYRLSTPLKIKSSFWDLLKLNYISIFYSSFVPGQASGELIKGLKLSRREGTNENVWVPIFIDKATNLLITFLIGFIAILFDKTFSKNYTLVICISVLTISATFLTIILFSEKTNHFVIFLRDNLIKALKKLNINYSHIKNFSLNYFEKYKKNDLLMFETLFWSLLIKLPHIFAFYFLALSLNINLNLIESAWLFSIVFLASILPISFSGLGVREGAVIILLSQLGVEKSISLSLSMLIFINGIITALIGGILELVSILESRSKH